jgi:hypothetical protein
LYLVTVSYLWSQTPGGRYTYIYGSFAQKTDTPLTIEDLRDVIFQDHGNDEFNVCRDGAVWKFRIKCTDRKTIGHFSDKLGANEHLCSLRFFTFGARRQRERIEHDKQFLALPGKHFVFGGRSSGSAVSSIQCELSSSDAPSEVPQGDGNLAACVEVLVEQLRQQRADAKERECQLQAEVERVRSEARVREDELKADLVRVRAEIRESILLAETSRGDSERAIQRLKDDVEYTLCTFDRQSVYTRDNMRRVELVLEHVGGHFDDAVCDVRPPLALGVTTDYNKGCFTVANCESLLLEHEAGLKESSLRAREVFQIVTHGRRLAPFGERGDAYCVDLYMTDQCTAFYSGWDQRGVRWERDSCGGWRVVARVF